MRQRVIFFLVVLVLMFSAESFGQVKHSGDTLFFKDWVWVKHTGDTAGQTHYNPQYIIVKPGDFIKLPINYNSLENFDFEKQLFLNKSVNDSVKKSPILRDLNVISRYNFLPSYYTNHLGFFCKKELQLDKITPAPIRFRLGSLDYVNWMEQKPNAIKPR